MSRSWGVFCRRIPTLGLALGLITGQSRAWANPEGGAVVAGQAHLTSTGKTLVIQQTSDRAVINWRDFSVQPGESTQFRQPSASSAVLNRVTSDAPSHILGQIQANGQVYLMNPNGIFFGPGAVINASSFLAATADLSPSEFMAGRLGSLIASDTGVIRNEGAIRGEQGSVQLLSKTIENTGTVEAPKGEVGLYAGRKFYLEPDGGGSVRNGTGINQQGIIRAAQARLEANGSIYSLAIQQGGIVEATGYSIRPNGVVVLSAPGGKIQNDGMLVAKKTGDRGGEIVMRAEKVESTLSSIVTASGSAGGGQIRIDADDTALLRGRLDLDSSAGRGGRLVVTGRQVGFLEGTVNASGHAGGGEVLLGGDYQGGNADIRNADATVLGEKARIFADATGIGDGGKVILWSDHYTGFFGQLFARGGAGGGNGGFMETSSHDNLQAYGLADASATLGSPGKWLLDPRNVFIQAGGTGTLSAGVFTPSADNATIDPTTITSALDVGTSVEINTGSTGSQAGDITVVNAVATGAGALDASLTLKAANHIIVNDVLNLSTMVGAGNISLLADADATGVGTVTLNAAVTSGALGTVTLQGAGRIQVGSTLTAKDVVFRPSTAGASMGVADSVGAVQVALNDLQNLSATGTVTLGRSDSTGTIRIGGAAALDLSAESYGVDFLTASLGQTRLNGNITTAGKAITFDSAVIITGDRTLKTDQGVATGAAITMNKAVDSDGLSGVTGAFWDLTLVAGTGGNVTFAQAVGVGARLGNITVGPANHLSIQGALRAESLSTASLVTLGGNVNLNGSLDFSNHGIASTAVGLNLVAAGEITLNAGADVTSGGAVTLEGAGGIETGADFSVVDSSITFRSPVTLTGPVALTVQGSTAGGGLPPEIRFESTLDSASVSLLPDLTLDAGSFGDVVFVGGGGQTNPLGEVQVVSANNLTVAAMRANSFLQSAGYGQTTFNGPQTYTAANGLSLGLGITTSGNIAVAAASITTGNGGTVTLNAGQSIDIGSGGDIISGGPVTLTAGSGITTGGDIETSGDAVQFNSTVLMASDLTIDTRDSSTVGNVTFSSSVDGPYSLEIFAGQVVDKVAVVTFNGSVGAINSLVDLDVKAESIQLKGSTYRMDELNPEPNPTVTFDGAVVLGADAVFDLEGVAADNSLSFLGTVNSDSTARSMQITTGSGVLRFDGAVGSLAALKDFFVISAGSWDSTGVINLTAATVNIRNSIQVAGPAVGMSIQASGLVTFVGNVGTVGTPLASLSIVGSSIRFGGTEIRTTGNLNLQTSIVTTPDFEGPGVDLSLLATTGDITATGLIDTRGKTGTSQQDGGDVTITTAGNISVADINASAGAGKDAGLISIDSGNGNTITLNGTLTATGGRNGSAVIFNDDVSLGAATSILTSGVTGTSGDITFAETLEGTQSITLNSGNADITFAGAVGQTPGSPLGVMTVAEAKNVSLGTVRAASFLQTSGTGVTTLGGAETYSSSLSIANDGSVLINGVVAMTGAGTVGLTADTITLNAALSSGSGAIGLTADTITLNAALSSVSGNIILQPFTPGLGMSISDSSATGLVLSKTETALIATSGQVTFGGASVGTIELAGTAGTAFGYHTVFDSGVGLNLNGNVDGGGTSLTMDIPTFNVATDATLKAGTLVWSGTMMNGVGRTLTLNVPTIDLSAVTGSDILLKPNLVFSRNTTLSADGLHPTFASSLGSLAGVEKLVVTAGETGNLSLLGPVGQGARVFGDLLAQGNRVTLGSGAFLRAGTVTVEANVWNNQAGAGALMSTTGRTLLFSDNPNLNSPTGFNAGVSGLNPIFNQPVRIELAGPGVYSVEGSLPAGSLAVYEAQLADVLPAEELSQFADQQAFLAAVPVTAFSLSMPILPPSSIRISQSAWPTKIRVRQPMSLDLSERFEQSGPRRERTPKIEADPGPTRAGGKAVSFITPLSLRESYSQYSQSFNPLNQ